MWLASLVLIVSVAWRQTSDTFDDALKEGSRLALVLGSELLERDEPDVQSESDMTQQGKSAKFKIYYQIVADDGRVLQRARKAPAQPFSSDLSLRNGYLNVWVGGKPWRVYVVRAQHQPFQVQIGQPWDERAELLGEMAERLAWPALGMLALLGIFCWWAIRRLLAPLDRTAARIAAKSADDLEAVPLAPEPRELQPIMRAFNGVLVRLAAALQAERRFTADAAHELRTPLAALRMRIQLLQRQHQQGGHSVSPAELQALRDEVDRSTALVESLLTLARLDPQRPQMLVKGNVPLAAEFAQLDRRLGAYARAKGMTLVFERGVDSVYAEPALLHSALHNLIDNALRYGAAGGCVRVQAVPLPGAVASAADGGVRLTVRDDGPGVAPAERARLGERFFRVLGTDESGNGLGLSIVARTAALHGALLRFESGLEGHGLGVVLDLPAV
jgi:two-component system sensor histidine kinase QseC